MEKFRLKLADGTEGFVLPVEQLQPATLRQVVREVLFREAGNDEQQDVDDVRVDRVLSALRQGTHVLTFDPVSETVGLADIRHLASPT